MPAQGRGKRRPRCAAGRSVRAAGPAPVPGRDSRWRPAVVTVGETPFRPAGAAPGAAAGARLLAVPGSGGARSCSRGLCRPKPASSPRHRGAAVTGPVRCSVQGRKKITRAIARRALSEEPSTPGASELNPPAWGRRGRRQRALSGCSGGDRGSLGSGDESHPTVPPPRPLLPRCPPHSWQFTPQNGGKLSEQTKTVLWFLSCRAGVPVTGAKGVRNGGGWCAGAKGKARRA